MVLSRDLHGKNATVFTRVPTGKTAGMGRILLTAEREPEWWETRGNGY